MAEEGYLLDAESIQKLRDIYNFLMNFAEYPRRGRKVVYPSGSPGDVEGHLTSTMTAASSSLTGSKFTFVRLVNDGSVDPQTDPITLKKEVDEDGVIVDTDGVNRSSLTGNVDDYVICSRINGTWRPILIIPACPDE